MIANILDQLLTGILQLKAKDICHRDLKPHNVFVEETKGDIQVKMNDYFIEQTFNHQRIIKNRYGSIYFTAPEVVDHQHMPECVIWNFGVIMYLLYFGELPFDGNWVQGIN